MSTYNNFPYEWTVLYDNILLPNYPSPLDIRSVIDTYDNLISVSNWGSYNEDEGCWGSKLYKGIIVAVIDDPDSTKNGVYILKEEPFTEETAVDPNYNTFTGWEKLLALPNTDDYTNGDYSVLEYDSGDGTFSWVKKEIPQSLNDLTDVTITNPSDGQVLKYNSEDQKWYPADDNGGSGSGGSGVTSETISYKSLFDTKASGGLGYEEQGEQGKGFGWLKSGSFGDGYNIPSGTSYDTIFKKIFIGENFGISDISKTVTYNGTLQYINPTFSCPSGYIKQYYDTTTNEWKEFVSNCCGETNVGVYNYNFRIVDSSNNIKYGPIQGTLTINKLTIKVTSGSASKVWDGTALTNSNYTITVGSTTKTLAQIQSQYDSTLTSITTSGTITDVGTATNTLNISTTSSNVTYDTINGTLTVKGHVQYSIDNGATKTTITPGTPILIDDSEPRVSDNPDNNITNDNNVYYVNGSSYWNKDSNNVFYIYLIGNPEQDFDSKWYYDDTKGKWIAVTTGSQWSKITKQTVSDNTVPYKYSNKASSGGVEEEIQFENIRLAFTIKNK